MDETRSDGTPIGHERRATRRAIVRGVSSGGVAAAFLAAGWTVAPARTQDATPGATPDPAAANAVVVLFGQPTDEAAFEEYYLGTHRPLALGIPGLQEILGGPVLGTLEGGEAEYHRIAILRFADRVDLEAGLASPEGQEAFADVPNFATGGVTAFLVELEAAVPGAGAGAGMATPDA